MCCLKIYTDTLLANCLNTCRTKSFSADDLQKIVQKIALCEKWKQEGKTLPMNYFNFGYAADTINLLTETAQKFCEQ